MYDSQTGELTVGLSVGTYIINMVEDNPRDENASEFRKFSADLPTIEIGLGPSGEPVDIRLTLDYLVAGSVEMESGFPLVNSTVWLRNDAGDDFYPLTVDENGTFAEYIPQGEWFVEVDDYQSDSNETEIYRGVITVEGAVTDYFFKTKTAMTVNLQLQESQTSPTLLLQELLQ